MKDNEIVTQLRMIRAYAMCGQQLADGNSSHAFNEVHNQITSLIMMIESDEDEPELPTEQERRKVYLRLNGNS